MNNGILVRVAPFKRGKYEMVCLRNGISHTSIIDANSHAEATRVAAQITGCDESVVMLPVTQAEIDVILNDD